MNLVISGLSSRMRYRSAMLLLICFLALIEQSSAARNEVRCASIDIRNNPYFGTSSSISPTARSETECTIVEGDFSLSMITEENIRDEMFPVFKHLREITGALLVFQIKGLTSLGRMFPNLRVIGGQSLIMNYALVVYQNQDLKNVGLTKLSLIKNGGVRIAENSRLCYARNINWDNMIVGNLRDVILDTVESQCPDQCVVANETRCYHPKPGVVSCWNATECQTYCPYNKFENGTFGPGCSESGEICHHSCLGGCTFPNDPGSCHSCRHVEVHGICAEKCPETMFEQLGRRCLTKEQCNSLRPMANTISPKDEVAWKPFKGKCHFDCPAGYEEDQNNNRSCIKCIGHCPKKCKGDDAIDSIGAALKFKDCNIIIGNLEIEIRIGNEANAEKFSEAFGEVEEITGYLMIRFSSVFVSLHMFKNLRVIHGNTLWRSNYALVVFDNQNLRELFNLKTHNISVLKGKVHFQNNRMLCYNKIEEFLAHIGKLKEVTDIDVSTYSNGDRAVCEELLLEVEVTFVTADVFSIRWTPFNTSDMDYRKFIGYQIFYKKVDKIDPDLSINEDRSACADTWKMIFTDSSPPGDSPMDESMSTSKSSDGGALISQGIEANTLYAFYVQTRIVNHPGARNAISKIHFVKTNFGPPSPPRIRVYNAQGPDRIELMWSAPLEPQGVITHYLVHWQFPEPSEFVEEINGCGDELPKPSNDALISKKSKKPGTCSAQEGCCDCSLIKNGTSDDADEDAESGGSKELKMSNEEIEALRAERDTFENAIQNIVFVQHCNVSKDPRFCGPPQEPKVDPPWTPNMHIKRRRHINANSQTSRRTLPAPFDRTTTTTTASPASRNKRQAPETVNMDPELVKKIVARNETAFNISIVNVSDPNFPSEFRQNGKINITGNHLLITGLPHFTEYVIYIYACQDINEADNSCSPRPGWVTVRTSASIENDRVNSDTIHVLNVTNGKENDRRFNWAPPEDPNGAVLAYKVKLFRDNVNTAPLYKCVNRTQFTEGEGVTFSNLAGGTYSIEVRAVTLAGVGPPAVIKDILYLYIPLMTKRTFFIVCASVLSLLFLLTGITYFLFRYYCRKINEDKVHQLLSSNPEYLSQIDVYKKDEWELSRDRIVLGKEIGSGTFGKVYRGIGNDIVAVNGAVFGECAVKTISDQNNMDRFHFLIEASVMKQFNTNFIVKLFGVVSDSPVLVVMELMEKGNLRDFLRAHRPGSEENAGSRYNLPTPEQYYSWTAQIADGMAYLESLRFCHRDLAARNCMVHANETVKIGDFGMARDIYYREYYKPQGRRLMPIRWLSPESLKDGKFTLKSDVWSFGVVLYEMLTLGQQPYAGLANSQVFNYVCIQKRIMVKPKNCPSIWYKMMRACWQYDSRDRPTFWQIVQYLHDVTNEEFHEKSFVYNTADDTKRCEEDYDFDRDWPMEDNSRDNSFDGHEYEDEKKREIYIEQPGCEPQDSSCSCSECSDGEHNETTYIDPMQKSGVRNYLNSMGISNSTQFNAMSAKKSKERDMERLLDNQSDDESPNLTGMSNSFASQSTPSTSRLSSQQTRRTIDSDDKRAIRKALNKVKIKENDESWPNEERNELKNMPTDYLITGSPKVSLDQPGPSSKK